MFWSEFYENCWEWSDSTRRSRISSLEDIGPGKEVVEVVLDIQDEKVKAQLVRKAMKLGVSFEKDDFSDLEGELPFEVYQQIAAYAGYDAEDPFFELDEDLEWYAFCEKYEGWPTETIARRIPLLTDFDDIDTDEIVDMIESMPTIELSDTLYRQALAQGVRFNQEQKERIEGWTGTLVESIRDFATDSDLKILREKVDAACQWVDQVTAPPPKPKKIGLLAVIMGLFGGKTISHKQDGRCNGDCEHCPPHYGYRYGRWYYGHGHQRGCERGGNGGLKGKTYND